VRKLVLLLSLGTICFSYKALSNDSMVSSASNELDASISVDRQCQEKRKHLDVYRGGVSYHLLGQYNNLPIYIEDYLADIYIQINDQAPHISINYVDDPIKANVGFFPINYKAPGLLTLEFASLRRFFRKSKQQMYRKIKEISHGYAVLYEMYNDKYFSNKEEHYSGHAYCRKLNSSNERAAYVIFPLTHKSNTHISGKDCLRMDVLDTLCLRIDAPPKDIKKIVNKVFWSKGDGKDEISDYGKSVIRELLKNTGNEE